MVGQGIAQAFAAKWVVEETGEVVGYTYSRSWCHQPRKPWAIKFSGDGFEGVIPCGECPGCLELARRRLARRLVAKYGAESCELFIVELPVPLVSQAKVSHALHRRPGLHLEPGHFRCGLNTLMLITRNRCDGHALRTIFGTSVSVRRVARPSKRRGWRRITRGLLVSREAYGAQVKRFYVRGLPPAERERWEVEKRAMQKPWNRASGARARRHSKIILVPPEVWRLSRTARRDLRSRLASAGSPEEVSRIMGLVADTLRGQQSLFNLTEPAEGRLRREAVQAWYDDMRARRNARTETPDADSTTSPPSEGGGYVSSGHTGDANAPPESEHQRFLRGAREREQRQKAAGKSWIEEWSERMQRRVRKD